MTQTHDISVLVRMNGRKSARRRTIKVFPRSPSRHLKPEPTDSELNRITLTKIKDPNGTKATAPHKLRTLDPSKLRTPNLSAVSPRIDNKGQDLLKPYRNNRLSLASIQTEYLSSEEEKQPSNTTGELPESSSPAPSMLGGRRAGNLWKQILNLLKINNALCSIQTEHPDVAKEKSQSNNDFNQNFVLRKPVENQSRVEVLDIESSESSGIGSDPNLPVDRSSPGEHRMDKEQGGEEETMDIEEEAKETEETQVTQETPEVLEAQEVQRGVVSPSPSLGSPPDRLPLSSRSLLHVPNYDLGTPPRSIKYLPGRTEPECSPSKVSRQSVDPRPSLRLPVRLSSRRSTMLGPLRRVHSVFSCSACRDETDDESVETISIVSDQLSAYTCTCCSSTCCSPVPSPSPAPSSYPAPHSSSTRGNPTLVLSSPT